MIIVNNKECVKYIILKCSVVMFEYNSSTKRSVVVKRVVIFTLCEFSSPRVLLVIFGVNFISILLVLNDSFKH